MSLDDFIFDRQLGKGSFGSVNIVIRKEDNQKYAMKRVNINNLTEKEKLCSLNEIRLLSSLNHPNIIGYKEAFFDTKTKTLNIVMEYAECGDLQNKIKKNIKAHLHFTENTIWDWIIQILEGLKYLHDNKIMHRDLKCANIFISKNGILKLGDLNVSILAKKGMAQTRTGTPYYCSPEIWKDLPYNYKSDVWSMGCIIYELCMLKPPFRGTSLKELFLNVIRGHYPPVIKYYSDDLRKIIDRMLVVDPKKRATVDELLTCDILKNKISKARKNIITDEVKNGNKSKKANFMETIKLPRNLKDINSKLPKKRYRAENEMMENDEYETMKATFFKEINNQMNNNGNMDNNYIFNNNNINYNKKDNYKRNNKDLNLNYNRQNNNNKIVNINKFNNMINVNNNVSRERREISKNENYNYMNNYIISKDKNNNYKNISNNNKNNYKKIENNNVKNYNYNKHYKTPDKNIDYINKNYNQFNLINNRDIQNNEIHKNIYNNNNNNNLIPKYRNKYIQNKNNNENNYINYENKDNNIDFNALNQNIKKIYNKDNNINNEYNRYQGNNFNNKAIINNYTKIKNGNDYQNNVKKNINVQQNILENDQTKNLQKLVAQNQNLFDDLFNVKNEENKYNIRENELFNININQKQEKYNNYKKINQQYYINNFNNMNKNIDNGNNYLEQRIYRNKRVITPDNNRNNRNNNIYNNYYNNNYNNYINKRKNIYNDNSYSNRNKKNNNNQNLNNINKIYKSKLINKVSNDNINNNYNDGEYIKIQNNHIQHNIYYSKKQNELNNNNLNNNKNYYINDPKNIFNNNKISYRNNNNYQINSNNDKYNNNNYHINNINYKYNNNGQNNNQYKFIDLNNLKINQYNNLMKDNNKNEILNNDRNKNINNYINNYNDYKFEFKYQYKRPPNKVSYEKINYNANHYYNKN